MDKKCKYCAMTIPEEAQICPYCRKKQPNKINMKSIFILFGVLIVLSSFLPKESPKQPPTKEEVAQKQEESDELDARVMTKLLIEKRLKAPSTAKWQSPNDFITEKIRGKKDTWRIYGYVDSQNSFGAMIRTQFWATLKKSADKWILIKLDTRP